MPLTAVADKFDELVVLRSLAPLLAAIAMDVSGACEGNALSSSRRVGMWSSANSLASMSSGEPEIALTDASLAARQGFRPLHRRLLRGCLRRQPRRLRRECLHRLLLGMGSRLKALPDSCPHVLPTVLGRRNKYGTCARTINSWRTPLESMRYGLRLPPTRKNTPPPCAAFQWIALEA